MSAWSIGARTVRPVPRAGSAKGLKAAPDQLTAGDAPTVDTLLEWIPSEVIAAYMALVVALQNNNTDGITKPTALGLLIGAIFASGLVTFLGGFASSDTLKGNWKELVANVVLSFIAFALWSLVLPGSWWQSIDAIAKHSTVVAIGAGLAAVVFGLFAQGIVRRLQRNAPNRSPWGIFR